MIAIIISVSKKKTILDIADPDLSLFPKSPLLEGYFLSLSF